MAAGCNCDGELTNASSAIMRTHLAANSSDSSTSCSSSWRNSRSFSFDNQKYVGELVDRFPTATSESLQLAPLRLSNWACNASAEGLGSPFYATFGRDSANSATAPWSSSNAQLQTTEDHTRSISRANSESCIVAHHGVRNPWNRRFSSVSVHELAVNKVRLKVRSAVHIRQRSFPDSGFAGGYSKESERETPNPRRKRSMSVTSATSASSGIWEENSDQERTDDDSRSTYISSLTKFSSLFTRNKLLRQAEKEKEGRDAIRWLRLAGFPQYAQMFYDGAFPIDLSSLNIESDHNFLDDASLDVLIRRLETLNKCAELGFALPDKDDYSDDEDFGAISGSWRFLKQSGTWARREKKKRVELGCFADLEQKEESPNDGEGSADKSSPSPADGEEEAAGSSGDTPLSDNAEEKSGTEVSSKGRRQKGLRRSQRVSQRPTFTKRTPDGTKVTINCDDDENEGHQRPRKHIRPTVRAKAPLPGKRHSGSKLDDTGEKDRSDGGPASCSDGDIVSLSDSLEDDSESEPDIDVQWTTRPKIPATNSLIGCNRVKWNSFLSNHTFKHRRGAVAISEMTVRQFCVLRKLSLLKLTSLLELSSTSSQGSQQFKPTKAISRLVKHFKTQDYKGKSVFGVPLHVTMQRTGQPLPQCILYALQYLHKNALDLVGLFRKAGSRNRVNQLKALNEEADDFNASSVDYSNVSPHDIVDMVKHYFRELPEPLFTSKMSESLLLIGAFVPEDLRLSSLQSAMLLMPDENREAIYTLLFFLRAVAHNSSVNSMTSHNLAVCWAPTLFALSTQQNMQPPSHSPQPVSPTLARKGKSKRKQGAKERDFDECSSAQIVLEMLIDFCHECMEVPEDSLVSCNFTHKNSGYPSYLADLGNSTDCLGGCSDYLENCLQDLLKEHNGGYRGWVQHSSVDSCDISYKKVGDGHPLWLWRGVIEIPAAADFVFERILRERHKWDEDIVQWRVIERISENADIFNYVILSMVPHKKREFITLRSWHRRESMIAIMTTSVKHPLVKCRGDTEAIDVATRYILESTSVSSTRVTFILRHDLRGRSANFYNRSYGPHCAASLCRLRQSFLTSSAGTSN